MDNFDDFTPSTKSSSTLASIFGKTTNTSESSSLIYTPTKQPRKEEVSSKTTSTIPEPSSVNAKLELIIFKSVHAYKLCGGAYQPIGKMGLALVGCQSPPVHQLLLYKTKEDVACKIRINSNHVLSILDNNYASFYSESQVNYSVMFETAADVEEFAQQFAIIKATLTPQMIVQDLLFSTGISVPDDGQIRVKVRTYQLIEDKAKLVAEKGEILVNLSAAGNPIWVQGLRGMKFGAKRVVILPKEEDSATGKSLLHIEIPAARAEEKSETVISSSGEESASFKEKGAIIEGAIAGKSQKSGLLSRVARLGQATLPLKGAVAADVTDSEEESSPSPSPKPRIRMKPSAATLRELPLKAVEKPVESVALYQQQYPVQALNPSYGGTLVATTPASLLSPLDCSLTAHFAESRTQAAELRMSLSKVSDKVDAVINKLDKVNKIHVQNSIVNAPVDGADGILASVQALVEENKKLKLTVEEQKMKIDTQSERIYHLLELSHKSLEQNAATVHKPQDDKLLIADFEDKLDKARNETLNTREMLEAANSSIANYVLQVSELSAKLAAADSAKNHLEQRIVEILDELQQSRCENLRLVDELAHNQNEKERLSRDVDDLKVQCNQLTDELNSVKQEVLQTQHSSTQLTKITVENDALKSQVAQKVAQLSELKSLKIDGAHTKTLMNRVFNKLHSEFQAESQYSGIAIKQVLASVIKELTLEFLQQPNIVTSEPMLAEPPSELAQLSSPMADRNHQAIEQESPCSTLNKLDEENQITYNQVWQTNEPPPLPTFDEEDENVWC